MQHTSPLIYIVLPTYNEKGDIVSLIEEIVALGYVHVVIVDDGSNGWYQEKLRTVRHATVLHHEINRGAGAATQTGISYALKQGAEYIVTIDSDGQHSPHNIPALLLPLLNNSYDVVIGSRFLRKENHIPFLRICANRIGNILTRLLGGVALTDTQSGFRAFRRSAAEQIYIHSNGFEFASEVVREIRWKKLSYCEVPIHVTYTKETMRKGQSFAEGLKTALKLILRSLMR